MTRQEEILKLIDEEMGIDGYGSCDFRVGVCYAVRYADKTMIDKACEILKNVTVTYNRRFFGKCEENAFDTDFIKEFRKAMEE